MRFRLPGTAVWTPIDFDEGFTRILHEGVTMQRRNGCRHKNSSQQLQSNAFGYLSFYLLSAFVGFQLGSEEKQATIQRLLFPNNNREKYSVRKAITTYLPINVRVAERGVPRYATSIYIWNVVGGYIIGSKYSNIFFFLTPCIFIP